MAHLRAGNSQQSTLKGEGYYGRCPTGFISHSLRDTFWTCPNVVGSYWVILGHVGSYWVMLGHVGSCCWVWDTFKRPFKMRFWDGWGSMPALKAARELDRRISRTVGESWCLALDSSVSMTPFFALSLWQKKTESNLPCWKIPHFFPVTNHYKSPLWMILIFEDTHYTNCGYVSPINYQTSAPAEEICSSSGSAKLWPDDPWRNLWFVVLCQVASGDLT